MAKKEQTQLDIDISNAIKMGMSYGMYIGLVKPRPAEVPKKKKERRRSCLHCGDDITYRHSKALYCCDACRIKHRTKQTLARMLKKNCKVCGKEFVGVYYRQCCSDECARKAQSDNMKAIHARKKQEVEL